MNSDQGKSAAPNHIVRLRYPGKVERTVGQMLVVLTGGAILFSMWFFSGDMNTFDTVLCCFLTWVITVMIAIALKEMPPANEYSTDPYILSVVLIAAFLIAPVLSDTVALFYMKLPFYALSIFTGQSLDTFTNMLFIDVQG
ncbi:hypothetical protein P3602_24510 [Vibrio parahaemolyticus]|uniref:hypothetical protein n=1 Tax=Vibrio TaxID=662 RepID=UPI001CDCD5D9|nr:MULTISPECIES: hypothetical protein [Vibrio]MDF5109081.1 hypothetical protein [Vibrio parahaemolyticus]MCA2420928.1 hypothetical protein [Vibrio alginolyticus]MCA2445703.1 hypothetical protein [Vibrio alginolyticus]MDF5143981.1 hypothetical protein [Vibrio parahaemolyticus]MDF5154408.1 hypothetical protein [Vibrio parahaemolyticus]